MTVAGTSFAVEAINLQTDTEAEFSLECPTIIVHHLPKAHNIHLPTIYTYILSRVSVIPKFWFT